MRQPNFQLQGIDQGENEKVLLVGPLNESNKWIYSRLLSITEEANNLTGFWKIIAHTTYEASSKKRWRLFI